MSSLHKKKDFIKSKMQEERLESLIKAIKTECILLSAKVTADTTTWTSTGQWAPTQPIPPKPAFFKS